jgi:hypothetical protein
VKCEHCGATVDSDEKFEHLGQELCEDCYMDALSPTKACDPWAVYSAKSHENHAKNEAELNPVQIQILDILKETKGLEKEELMARFEGKLGLKDLEREFTALRHMEKARAEKRGDKIFLILW